MKKFIALTVAFCAFAIAPTSSAGTWGWIANPAPFFPDNMILMTDGTVLITDRYSTSTALMTPDSSGNYQNGTWALGPSLAHDHLFNSSAVLKDGSTIICGGEITDGQNNDGNLCERLPLSRAAWQQIPSPAGVSNIGDMAAAVLPNGNFFLFGWSDPNGSPITPAQIFNPSTGAWTAAATSLYNDRENGLALTQDGTLLTVQTWVVNAPPSVAAEKYVASTGAWVATPNLAASLGDGIIGEIGPAIGLPDGRVFVAGENGQTALYSPGPVDTDPGTWAAGPVMPVVGGVQTGSPDASAVLLPNGNVLFVGMPLVTNSWAPPYWFIFDPIANTITQDTSAPSSFFIGVDGSSAIMLLTPDGQVLVYVNDTLMLIYTPDGPPLATAKPTLTTFPFGVHVGRAYNFGGLGLHGLSQACAYNDEFQSATNYPLVKFVDSNGLVTYGQTYRFSTMATTPGLHSGGSFLVPPGLTPGLYSATAVVNGISSDPVAVTVFP